MKEPTACFIVPCFNEGARLPSADYVAFLEGTSSIDLCFVDDHSSDNTLEVLYEIKNKHPDQVGVLHLEKNSGKGEAVRQGVLHCMEHKDVEVLGYMDADLATSLQEMHRLLTLLAEDKEADLCFGSRILKIGSDIRRNEMRHYLGRIVATFISRALDLEVYDTQCGCKLFRNELAEKVFQEPFISKWLFDVELFFRVMELYGRKEAVSKMREVPLLRWVDPGGSKIRWTDLFSIWTDLYKIRREYRPRVPVKRKDQDPSSKTT